MTRYDVDLFVIGGGSGGVRAARVAAEHGARVAIAESNRWGGTCVIRGCVPKKLLVYASEVSRTLDDARGNGWTIDGRRFDWPALVAAKDKEIARLSNAYVERLRGAGCEIFDARARIADAHTIEVGGKRVTAANILVATGSVPKRPAGEWITSDEAFHLGSLPKRVAIFGGGYIGVEFAHIFAGFGSEVTLVVRDRILRGFDPDLRDEVANGLTHHGIALEIGTPVASARKGNAIEVCIGDRTCEVDLAMAAVGRIPATAELGLAEIGVRIDDRGAVLVDEWSRSNLAHVYAVGDVTARVLLTPVAIREGHAVADTLFGNRPTPIRHHLIPTAVFAQPPAASIGLSEPTACDGGHDVVIYRARFRPMRYALSGRDEHVMIKVVVDRKTDRVLGIHIVGPDAPEIIQSVAVAMTMGATKADLDRTFALHPTTAEELVLLR
jgi:glutathione reductase (NADPH)